MRHTCSYGPDKGFENYHKVVPNLKSIKDIVVEKETDGSEIITRNGMSECLVGFTS